MGRRNQPTPLTLPTVNLLSPWVFEAMATRRLRQRFLVAGLVVAMLVGAGWGVQHLRVRQAQQVLVIEKAETDRLSTQTRELAPIRAFVTAVEQQKQTVQDTMSREIFFSEVLDGLREATPSSVTVDSVAVVLPPPPVEAPAVDTAADDPGADAPEQPAAPAPAIPSPCPGPDPFNTRTVVGCITLSGSADNRNTVGEFVIRLGKNKHFVEPFISTTTTADGQSVTFTGSVGLSDKVFSNRYADMDKLLRRGDLR